MLDRRKYEEALDEARKKQVDDLSAYLADAMRLNAGIREMPVSGDCDEALIREVTDLPIRRAGRDPKEVADELVEKVFTHTAVLQHPRFFSFVTSGVSPFALAGAILSDIYNINAGSFSLNPTAGIIEEKLIRRMGSLAGFGEECGGLFTSGGSLSNLTGFIAARARKLAETDYPKAVAYLSDQAHSSVKKGLFLAGLRHDQIRILPTDENFRMQPALLDAAIGEDLAAGKIPFLVVATLGTTNTGTIDPLDEIGKVKEKYNLWMHVDGAFGGSILFSEIYRHLAKGLSYADSMSWDTHKWAMQGYSSSCIIAKRKQDLVLTYAEHPEYLADIIDEEHTDGWDLGIEMSRPARGLKLWFTIQAMGTDLLSDVIDYSFFNANVAKREIEKRTGWEITSAPSCATLTFRYAPPEIDPAEYDEINAKISAEIIRRKIAYIVTTSIKGKRVLRMSLVNGNTTDRDVIETVAALDGIAKEIVF